MRVDFEKLIHEGLFDQAENAVRSGAEVNILDAQSGQTVGHLAAGLGLRGLIEALAERKDWDSCLQNALGMSALECAQAQGRMDIAQIVRHHQSQRKQQKRGPSDPNML